jgi:hypothetical protein
MYPIGALLMALTLSLSALATPSASMIDLISEALIARCGLIRADRKTKGDAKVQDPEDRSVCLSVGRLTAQTKYRNHLMNSLWFCRDSLDRKPAIDELSRFIEMFGDDSQIKYTCRNW